ncbi:GreA/GreB family elongation factor [Sphingobacterium pedocola]|uniref:3-oxoacyl-ACP synthase n=1 Tax=Sphingobacterium pedocola TaxID=2082722 RepID=A0ABR9T6E8_9SPHI|nr:3-oxoacyl-ACP synthase [Sphingobacterium pedocola]MBE8720597.1 3-oxoacyl-ACP synthase [Sphingobacterium pedocola]
MEIPTKREIVNVCFEHVQSRIQEIDRAIDDAQYALTEETKSSAGDKYETSREMIQQDFNRYQSQLNIANTDKNVLLQINSEIDHEEALLGSVITTNNGVYFLSISIGAITVSGMSIFVVSPASPIGQTLWGKKTNDTFEFNQKKNTILHVR